VCVLCRSWWRWSVFWWQSEGLILTEMQRLKACVIDSDSPLLHLIADHESDYFLKLLSLALRDLWQHSSHCIHIGLWWMATSCWCLWFCIFLKICDMIDYSTYPSIMKDIIVIHIFFLRYFITLAKQNNAFLTVFFLYTVFCNLFFVAVSSYSIIAVI